MAMTRPFGWLRRLRGRGPRGHVLATVCLVLGLVASGGGTRTAGSPPTLAPSEPLKVIQTVLCPGTMVFQMRNDGTQPVTIAQVSVNDAYWPFTANPGATLAPHRTAVVALRYAWDAGVAYEVQFISSTGAMYATTIDASTTAGAPPCS
jgi:ZIP family zinc transporter